MRKTQGAARVVGLRASLRIRHVGAILHPAPVPDGPGCSRWLTCSCCQHGRSRPNPTQPFDFFSSRPRGPLPSSPETASQSSDLDRTQITPSLPLPPRLPYSPSSRPFQRHLESLSLSLLSNDADESWRIYLALHPSLRRYIPDGVFKDLVDHQLAHELIEARGSRAMNLLNFAGKCGMPLSSFGRETLRRAFSAGVKCQDESDSKQIAGILADTLEHLRIADGGTYANLSTEDGRKWIDLLFAPTHRALSRNWRLNHRLLDSVFIPLRKFIEHGGAESLGGFLEDKLQSFYSLRTAPKLIDFVGFCWSHNVGISVESCKEHYRRLYGALNGNPDTSSLAQLFNKNRAAYATSPTAIANFQALEEDLRRYTGSVTEGFTFGGDSASDDQSVAQSLRLAHRILNSRMITSEEIDRATQLCSYAMRNPEVDSRDLITRIILVAIAQDKPFSSVRPFIQALLTRGNPQPLPSRALHPLFLLLAKSIDDDSYRLVQQAYSLARSSQPAFTWSLSTRHIWSSLFRFVIDSRKLHHASRLYSDLLADGLMAHRTDLLHMIRAIGSSRLSSKSILLERFVGDYIGKGGSSSNLLTTLATSALEGEDLEQALLLSRRILQNTELPPGPARIFAQRLARSNPAMSRELLLSIPAAEDLTRIYNDLLTVSARGLEQSTASNKLAAALDICREMCQRGVQANSRTVSILMRAFLEAGQVNAAVALFNESLLHGVRLKSAVIGRLMVRLALDGRIRAAEDIDEQWRKQSVGDWDRGVNGARFLIDVMKGKEVDLAKVKKDTNWTPNASFSAFLASQQAAVVAREKQPITPPAKHEPAHQDFDVRSFWHSPFRFSESPSRSGSQPFRMASV